MSDVIDLTSSVGAESSSDDVKEESICDLCGPEDVITTVSSEVIDVTQEQQQQQQDLEAESDNDSSSDDELLLDVAKEQQNKTETFSIHSISDADSDEELERRLPPAPSQDERERRRAARLQQLVNERPMSLMKASKQQLLGRITRLEQKLSLPHRPFRRNNGAVRKLPPAPRASACSAPSWASPTGYTAAH